MYLPGRISRSELEKKEAERERKVAEQLLLCGTLWQKFIGRSVDNGGL